MASEPQRGANRRNGPKGGPETEAGQQRSRLNTLKHGLTSTTLVVLPEEHEHEYAEVLRGFRDSFQPHNPAEDALVVRLAQAHWRSLRSRRVETGILNITAGNERARAKNIVEDCPEHLSPHNAIAVAFMINPAERWQMYLRYDTTIARDFFRTLDALTRLQRARQRGKAPERPVVAVAAASVSDSGIRFVSQNTKAQLNRNEHHSHTHDSKEQKTIEAGPTDRNARRVAHLTHNTSHRVGPEEKNLRRSSAAAGVLPRNSQRTSPRNSHALDRRRKPGNRASALRQKPGSCSLYTERNHKDAGKQTPPPSFVSRHQPSNSKKWL